VTTKSVVLEIDPLTPNSRSYLNRWIQPDSIIPNPSISQSWDRYSYVNNNPLKYTDPSGHNAYCDNEYADPEECTGMRQGINNLDDYILFEYRSPLHETYDYRNFGAYRGKWDYGNNPDIWHVSIDAGVPRDLGIKVYPVLPGVVTKVGWEDTSLGNYIVIKHETEYGNVYSVYGHLGTEVGNGNLVKEGIVVDKNTPIGTLGNTNGMPVHLHFEIRFETNVNASEGISGMDYWAFDSSWIYDFFDLGQIYGYVDNAAQGNPPLP
jgi:murein DD-endopeptidase MepM/ murein hydrolase activator NlpD